MHGKQRPTWVIKLTRCPVLEIWPCTSGLKGNVEVLAPCSQDPVVSLLPSHLGGLRMKFPFLTGSELMMGNVSWCNASRDNVSGRDELNFAWDPWEAQWGVSSSQPNPLNDTVAFQFSVSWLCSLLEWFGMGAGICRV